MLRVLIIAILLGFPVLEGALLFKAAQQHGFFVGVYLLLSALMGMALIKEARFALVARLGAALATGHFSLAALIDSGRTVLAGLLLIFPGFISDFLAILVLLLPFGNRDADSFATGFTPVRSAAIEGEFRRES